MPRPLAKRSGFTLLELLITLTILGVLGAVIAQLMMNQQRFFQRSVEQMSVRRELRTAMSVLPAELRSLSTSGGDLTALAPTQMQFRGLIGASIVCEKPSAQEVVLPPLDLAHNTLTSWYTDPVAGDTMYAFDEGNSRGAEDDTWVPLLITGVATTTSDCLGAPFTDPALDAGKRRFRVTVATNIPDSVKIGAGVRFYRHMRYTLTESSERKWYLSRAELLQGNWTSPTYISGPYRHPVQGGISFRYFDSTGVEVMSSASARDVARVDLILQAEGMQGSDPRYPTPPRDSLAFRIALRNRH